MYTQMSPADLVRWRETMRFSQLSACRELGCSRGAYINWEKGTTKIPKYIALACAAISYSLPPWR
jgi:transcriptional regulator with XRE-family HTH domain